MDDLLTHMFGATSAQPDTINVECDLPPAWNGDAVKRWFLDDVSIN